MNSLKRKPLTLLAPLALLLALSACNRAGDGLTGPRAGSGIDNSRASDVSAVGSARGTGASAAAAADTRTMGSSGAGKVDDASITAQVNAALAGDKDLATSRIDVDTQNGVVTLSGPTPSASAKERAAEIAHRVKGVDSVNNQLTITSG